jgi:dTMP kinase
MFITFEGIDGCGKSTQIKLLFEKLKELQLPIVLTREPGGTPISEKIRSLILDPENKEMTPSCELLLYLAARSQHITEKIRPALKKGDIVLSDRFEEATFVYQGYGRKILLKTIKELNRYATDNLKPDITFVIDIPVEESYKRIQIKNKIRDRMEDNTRQFFETIRKGYLLQCEMNEGQYIIIDGCLPIDEISQKIYTHVFNQIKYRISS